MPMLKIGASHYDGKVTPIYIMQGNATRDAEDKPVNGKDHAVVGIAATEDAQGDTVYVNLNGWRNMRDTVISVQKGDSVLAVGRLKKREYNGRDYYDLDADFVCKNGAGFGEAVRYDGPPPSFGELPGLDDAPPVGADGFAEVSEEGDGELPF